MAQTIKLKRSGTSGAVPTTSQLELGEVAINTYDGKMYIKKNVGGTESIVEIGSGATSADAIFEEYIYTATSGQTSFSGSDDNSLTLSYISGAIQVFLNGVLLDPDTDYTATNGTTVVLASGATASDLLQVFAFKKKIGDGQTTVDTFTGNNSTTAFTLSLDPGDENNTRVYIDGVYQSKSNYSVSGTTLTFSTAPPTGTAIEVEIGNRVVTLDTLSDLDLPDNVKLRLGTSQDADFYHDGTDTYLRNQTGQLLIRGNDTKLQSYLGETYATFANNGAATLYYDNSAKLATTSSGATVTGILVADGLDLGDSESVRLGASQDLQLYHDGSNSYIYDAGTGYMVLMSNGPGIRLNKNNAEVMLDATPDGAVSLYYDNAVKIATTSTGVSVTGNIVTDGEIRGPATFVIDPAAVGDNTGTVQIKGNLQVDGTQTIINSTTLTVDDLNITLASGAANATAANGAGITIDGASATLTYDSSNDTWDFNKRIEVTGAFNATTAGSKPSITGAGIYGGGIGFIDTNVSGIYTDTSGANLKFFTNQSSSDTAASKVAMTINGSGQVGIGTASINSDSILHLKSTQPNIYFEDTDDSKSWRLEAGAVFKLQNITTSSEVFRIDQSDHLLINNTAYSALGTVVVQQTADSKGIAIIDSAAQNTFFFENEGDECKLRNNSANPITFSQNAGERMRIDSSGNVGIGITTNIASKLHVNTEMSLGADGDNRGIVGYTSSRFYIGTRQSGTNYFDTVSVTDGNVGIGEIAPSRKLSVKKDTTITTGFNDITEFLDTTIGAGGSVSLNVGRANSTKNLGKMAFKYAGSGSNSNALNFGFYDADNLMTLTAEGNVGIGNSSPNYKLDITAAGNGINITGTGAYLRWNAGDIQIKNEGSYKMGFYTYNSSDTTLNRHMVIDTDGNVGIGTDSPAGNLDVQENTTGQLLARVWNPNTSGTGTSVLRVANSGNNAQGTRIEFTDQSYYVGSISSDRTNGIQFGVNATGNTGVATERWRIDTGGLLTGPRRATTGAVIGENISWNGSNWSNIDTSYGAAFLQIGDSGTLYFRKTSAGSGSQSAGYVLSINSSGNMGIGYSNSTQKLFVAGGVFSGLPLTSLGSPGSYMMNATALDYYDNGSRLWSWGSSTARGTFKFIQLENDGQNQQTALEIDSEGRVGIGVTPNGSNHLDDVILQFPSNYAIGGAYSSFGETASGQSTIIGNNIRAEVGANNQVVRHNSGSDAGNFLKLTYNQGFTIHTGITSTLGTGVDHTINERLRVDTSGNVGIGTDSPSCKLNILAGNGTANGNVAFKIGGPSNYQSLEMGIGPDTYAGFIRSFGNDLHYYSGHWRTVGSTASENHQHYWYTSKSGSSNWSDAKMKLDENGDLFVGHGVNKARLKTDGTNTYLDAIPGSGGVHFRTGGAIEKANINSTGTFTHNNNGQIHALREHFSQSNSSLTAADMSKTTGTLPFRGFSDLGTINLRGFATYVDFKTNYTADNLMFMFRFEGYLYNRGNSIFVGGGYTYGSPTNSVIAKDVGSANAITGPAYVYDLYRASDGALCVKIANAASGYDEGKVNVSIFSFGSLPTMRIVSARVTNSTTNYY